MSEQRKVPGFYPDFANADKFRAWDGSEQAKAWAKLMDFRDGCISASVVDLEGMDFENIDYRGLIALLWNIEEEEAREVVRRRQGLEEVEELEEELRRRSVEAEREQLEREISGNLTPADEEMIDLREKRLRRRAEEKDEYINQVGPERYAIECIIARMTDVELKRILFGLPQPAREVVRRVIDEAGGADEDPF